MAQVVGHCGRDGPAFGKGRAQGKGILQATLAVRREWGGNTPEPPSSACWRRRLTAPLRRWRRPTRRPCCCSAAARGLIAP